MSLVRRTGALGLLLAPVLVLSVACGGSTGTNNAGFISGDGTVQEIPVAKRGDPVELSGTTLEGKHLSMAESRGKVTVINVWGAWCGACVAEAPVLSDVYDAYSGKVAFVGIDIRDTSTAKPLSFERGNDVSYPSLYDPKGTVLLALSDYSSPRATPATIVLDKQGRVAAAINGALTSRATLAGVIEDAGGPTAPSSLTGGAG
ncbi:MAG: TlpA disulfide reductase family protein [Nocardioides sp.]|uniref:TlpA family protein disulfide reductase n=1 Tax=Nocardioides sp. TaxID=35761 RepID=UPI0039E4D159